jgi:hypothetical protein
MASPKGRTSSTWSRRAWPGSRRVRAARGELRSVLTAICGPSVVTPKGHTE